MGDGPRVTEPGQILGTPQYMANEQASAHGEVTPATDRCALGLIAYRLLVGESYYKGGVLAVLGQLLHAERARPSELGSRLGTAFDAWFMRATHRTPELRFPSAIEQIEALGAALGAAPSSEGVRRERSKRAMALGCRYGDGGGRDTGRSGDVSSKRGEQKARFAGALGMLGNGALGLGRCAHPENLGAELYGLYELRSRSTRIALGQRERAGLRDIRREMFSSVGYCHVG